MPKSFSELEKQRIQQRLIDVTEQRLKSHGFKKTTVDDLVKETHIAKGTFYLFYESKEQLVYDVFRRAHDAIQDQFIETIETMTDAINVERLTDVIVEMVHQLDESFIYKFVSDGDLELVMRKLPDSYLISHHQRDEVMMRKLISLFPSTNRASVEVFSAAVRMALTSILHKKDIGETLFDEALKMTLKGIIIQMLKEEHHD